LVLRAATPTQQALTHTKRWSEAICTFAARLGRATAFVPVAMRQRREIDKAIEWQRHPARRYLFFDSLNKSNELSAT
jgi:hypothetical protein